MTTLLAASRDLHGIPGATVTPVHHSDEVIDGRTYRIEVSRVGQDRWRASVVRTPGVPTAMMQIGRASCRERV